MTSAWRVASENSIGIANKRSFKAELVNVEFGESICNYCDESKLKEQRRARKGHFSARGKGRIVHDQGSSGKMDSPQSSEAQRAGNVTALMVTVKKVCLKCQYLLSA